jgi:oxaloacetate decarboxylase gamma subunit
MPITDLMMTGVELMLLGMGIVFGFLILLVFTLKVMSWLAGRYLPQETPSPVSAAAQPGAADATLIAVISAAVARYRSDRKA